MFKLYIPTIITRTSCLVHGASRGVPCYFIPSVSNKFGYYPAVCNKRAHDAGFVGKPSKTALLSKKR